MAGTTLVAGVVGNLGGILTAFSMALAIVLMLA